MDRSGDEKQRRERAQFERFASACGCVPLLPREQPEPPEPDVVFGPPGARVGVELTDLHPMGDEQRRREGEQASVLAAARAAYESAGHPPVDVWVSWTRHPRLARRAALAARLAAIVAAHPPDTPGIREVGDWWHPIAPDFPVTRIGIAEALSWPTSEWRDGDMHRVGMCTPDDIQARITLEDPKVDRYRVTYASRWLVLVVGAAGPSTWGDVAADVLEETFRTRYDRVFVSDHAHARAYELRLASRAAGGHRRAAS